MQTELVGFRTLPGADEIRILNGDLRFVIDIDMDTVAGMGGPVGLRASGKGFVDPRDTERRQILVAPGILGIVFGEITNAHALPAPLRFLTFGVVPMPPSGTNRTIGVAVPNGVTSFRRSELLGPKARASRDGASGTDDRPIVLGGEGATDHRQYFASLPA